MCGFDMEFGFVKGREHAFIALAGHCWNGISNDEIKETTAPQKKSEPMPQKGRVR